MALRAMCKYSILLTPTPIHMHNACHPHLHHVPYHVWVIPPSSIMGHPHLIQAIAHCYTCAQSTCGGATPGALLLAGEDMLQGLSSHLAQDLVLWMDGYHAIRTPHSRGGVMSGNDPLFPIFPLFSPLSLSSLLLFCFLLLLLFLVLVPLHSHSVP